MKKKVLSRLIVLALLSGCAINRNGSYSKTIYKTKSKKVIVTGTVYDTDKNNRTLPFVAITSPDNTILTTADRYGKYRFEVQKGSHTFLASYLGYLIPSTKPIKLVEGDSIVVDFVLKESLQKTTN